MGTPTELVADTAKPLRCLKSVSAVPPIPVMTGMDRSTYAKCQKQKWGRSPNSRVQLRDSFRRSERVQSGEHVHDCALCLVAGHSKVVT
jgi:hypothetical protein